VINYDFYEIIRATDLFGHHPKVLKMVLTSLQIKLFSPEMKVIEHGEYSKNIYFVTLDRSHWIFVETLEAGDMFGETTAVLGCRSCFQAICRNYCTIAALEDAKYHEMSALFPTMGPKVAELI
jgi:CRP-like cAMP-binding protein